MLTYACVLLKNTQILELFVLAVLEDTRMHVQWAKQSIWVSGCIYYDGHSMQSVICIRHFC